MEFFNFFELSERIFVIVTCSDIKMNTTPESRQIQNSKRERKYKSQFLEGAK